MVAAPVSHTWETLVGAPMPSRRQEEWRFTDLAALARLTPRLWSGPDPWAGVELPRGVTRLSDVAAQQQAASVLDLTRGSSQWPVLLNRAAQPGLLALAVQGEAGPLLLDLDAAARSEVLGAQLVLVLEPGASMDLTLRLSAAGSGLTSLLVTAVLAEEAQLNLCAVGAGHQDASLLVQLAIVQEPGSALQLSSVSAGWGFSRWEPRVLQRAGSASTRLRALQWVGHQQLADTHSLVRFEGPEGRLDQLHKAVADGTGRSVFNGAVQVPCQAQRTDAAQLSRSLLLSDRGRIDTKPELEIVADDVKCAHGATVSQLQSDELFYLRSRGIGEAQAARLLLDGYCQEVLRELPPAAAEWQPLLSRLQGN